MPFKTLPISSVLVITHLSSMALVSFHHNRNKLGKIPVVTKTWVLKLDNRVYIPILPLTNCVSTGTFVLLSLSFPMCKWCRPRRMQWGTRRKTLLSTLPSWGGRLRKCLIWRWRKHFSHQFSTLENSLPSYPEKPRKMNCQITQNILWLYYSFSLFLFFAGCWGDKVHVKVSSIKNNSFFFLSYQEPSLVGLEIDFK